MYAIAKAVMFILIPAIYLVNCAHSTNLKENLEFEIFSQVKKSEMISRVVPNIRDYLAPRQRCGQRLYDDVKSACDQLAKQKSSKRSSYTGSQVYSPHKRSLIVEKCCNQPCTITDLLKYCPNRAPESPAEINRPHIHSTSRPAMNVPRRVRPLEVYEKNTERNLICIPQFNAGHNSDRVVDHLGNHWIKLIRVNQSSVSDQMSNVKSEPTQNITLERTKSETSQTPEESAEPFGPDSSEEHVFAPGHYNY